MLTLAQEFIADKSDLVDFQGGNLLTISPDGKRLYAAGTVSCSLACFSRDPESGQLSYLSTLRDESTGLGSKLGANGVVCSPDGKFLYLALEDASAISVFERKTQ
jgi:sugar lactone lactonase YvrE